MRSVACILVLTTLSAEAVLAVPPSPNVAFVTSTTCTGKFADCPHAGAAVGLAAADAECADRAVAGGLSGEFHAWVSTATAPETDAYCHLHDLTGKRFAASPCNIGALPTGAGPWELRGHVPFAGSSPTLVAPGLVVFNPPRLDESGNVVSERIWTGTGSSGDITSQTCLNWTSDSSAESGTLGNTNDTGFGWTNYGSDPCSVPHHLLCFQTGLGIPLAIRSGGARLAFVTGATGNGKLSTWAAAAGQSGLAGGDAICRNAAIAATLPYPTSFVAWLSTDGTNAISRLANDGEWMRLDRVRVASGKAQLTSGQLKSPINLTEQGVYLGNHGVWTGTQSDGTANASTCTGWDANVGNGREGTAQDIVSWSSSFPGDCSTSQHIYCLQDLSFDFYDGFEWGDTTGWPAAQSGP